MQSRHNIIYTLLFYFSFFAFTPGELKLLKYVTIVILLGYVLKNNVFHIRQFKKLNTIIFVFSSVVLLSGIVGDLKYGHYDWHVNVTSSILLVFQVITVFGYVETLINKNLQTVFIKQMIQVLGLMLVINDLEILFRVKGLVDEPDVTFFLGSKFGVSYSHLLFCALLFSYKKIPIAGKIILLLFCVFISRLVFCSTGLIGAFSFIIFFLFEKIGGRLLYKRIIFLGSIILSISFAFVIIFVMSTPWFIAFVEKLGESPTLTGRTNIYIHLVDIIAGSPFLGFGNGNSQMYVMYYTEVGNAQNGMLADVVDWGIVGTLFFLMIPLRILKQSKYNRYSYPLLCMLYTYVIAGMVEVTMAIRFILALSLFLLLSGYMEDNQTKIIRRK